MRNLRARALQLLFALLLLSIALFFFSAPSLSPEHILETLQSPDPTLRLEALQQIPLPLENPHFLPLLLLALEDPLPLLSQTALQKLQQVPPPLLLPVLLSTYPQKSIPIQQQFLQILEHLSLKNPSPELLLFLKKTLQQESPLIRQQAFSTLVSMAPITDTSFEPYFILALQDTLPEIRRSALQLLQTTQNPQIVPSLIPSLQDSQITVRQQALQTLTHLGKTFPETLPFFIQATSQLPPILYPDLLQIFQSIGKPAFEATPFVLNCLQSSDEWTQLHAIRCAGSFQAVASVPRLLSFLQHPERPLFPATLKALAQIQHPQAISHLIPLLYTVPKEHRDLLSWTLAQMPAKQVFPALKPLLQDTKLYVRKQALWILGELQDPIGIFALALALKDEDYLARREAIQALKKLDRYAQMILTDIENASHDVDEEVRTSAKQILQKFHSTATSSD